MLFSSITFLILFLPVTLAVYYLIPVRWKNLVLLIASLFFYAWGEPVYVILMILTIAFNYYAGQEIALKKEEGERPLRSLVFALCVNFLILGFFKYAGFFAGIAGTILHREFLFRELSLPIGISFYTFQAVSYLIDVYRGDARLQKNPLNFALYITMFPQLIAGPIVRYSEIEQQLDHRTLSWEKFGAGARFFILGLGKKAVLANGIGAIYEAIHPQVPANSAAGLAWLGAVAYTLQIYFDFSGYSDMAIGLGGMFGFRLPVNFRYPYRSLSITEFWRRWHISLSSWFREYVYIPLGGNRVPVGRHILNLLIVWTLTGFWHGASWNFIVWGFYYGILLILEKYVWGRALERLPVWTRHLYSMVIVVIGWVFFFSDDLAGAFRYLHTMFGGGGFGSCARQVYSLIGSNWLLWAAGLCVAVGLPLKIAKRFRAYRFHPYMTIAADLVLFALSIACLITDTFNPFLYFRF